MHGLRSAQAPQDINVDLEMYNTNELMPPRSPFNKGTLRKLKRILTGRRYLAILTLFAVLVFFSFNSAASISSYQSWSFSSQFKCLSDLAVTQFLKPPPSRDITPVSQTWDTLRTILDAYPPSPSPLANPHTGGDSDFPFKDGLRDILGLTNASAQSTRIQHTSVVRHLPPYPEDQFSGRGIIMLAGGKYSEFAATALGMLRTAGSTLPVELWMKDRTEETEGWCAELEKDGVACQRLQDYMDMSALIHPYQWKVFVMLFSSFEEFIFLDADDMPIRNPDLIFDSDVYRDHGAILWPDYWKNSGSTWLPYIIGISDGESKMLEAERTVESGQLVWDKRRHWKSLCLATYYNYYGPHYFYTLLSQGWAGWGDKDTFPMALKALDEPYFQVTHDIITMFVEGTLLGIGMVQADPTNTTGTSPMFLHSNIVKWSMRDFLCVGCPAISGDGGFISHLESTSSPIHTHLLEGKRIFATNQLAEHQMDPEPLIWKVIEKTACRSVWGNGQVCQQARDHMSRVFGFKFTTSRFGWLFGNAGTVCIIDP